MNHTSKRSAKSTTTSPEESLEHLLRRHLLFPAAARRRTGGSPLREPAERVLRLRLAEPRVRIGAEAVELFPLLLVAEHAERAADHLECLIGMLMTVLVGVGQEGLFAVRLLDLGLGACLLHFF